MSRGPDQVTSTTRSDPSPLISRQIGTASSAAENAYGVNPINLDFQSQGLDAMFNRGSQGSPLTQSAQNLTQNTIQGDYLNSNPYLDQMFNRAADVTRTRLSSEFAGMGRDLAASLPARSDELQGLAANIYGGNYQAERDRQMNAVNQSMPLANQDYTDINAMLDAANLPLDQFINRIQALAPAAGGTAVSSQPVFRTGLFG